MRTTYTVENYQHVSGKTYEELVAEFEDVTGDGEMGLVNQALSAASTAREWEESLKDLMGPSGFGRAFSMDHGRWLTFYGTAAKAKRYVYGNPVVAETIVRHDTRGGLQVPLSVLIYEDADGHGCVTYDLPSSVMGFIGNPGLRQAVAALDAKLTSFMEKLTGVPGRHRGLLQQRQRLAPGHRGRARQGQEREHPEAVRRSLRPPDPAGPVH